MAEQDDDVADLKDLDDLGLGDDEDAASPAGFLFFARRKLVNALTCCMTPIIFASTCRHVFLILETYLRLIFEFCLTHGLCNTEDFG